MIQQVIAAFERQDYKTAAQLVKQMLSQSPHDPWAKLYVGKLQEVSGKLEAAESVYRQLLRETANPKLAIQARQGLQRLEAAIKAKRQEAIAQASAQSAGNGIGFLVLTPIANELKREAAKAFAKIMSIDPYMARLQLPSRGWRMYRTGALAELQVYCQELNTAGIPAFCYALTDIQAVRVFRVEYLQALEPQVTVVCKNETGQVGSLNFEWAEVTQRVRGLLPIFGDVIDLNAWKKLQRKEQTQDYAQIYDLHLPGRSCILRFFDESYDFQQGVMFSAVDANQKGRSPSTIRANWNQLQAMLDQSLNHIPLWADFTSFAEKALEHLDFVEGLNSYIDLLREAESTWDQAFQLYSSLIFLEHNATF
jgi:hypothetical protein